MTNIATNEGWTEYINSLPEITPEMLYTVNVVCKDAVHSHGLVLAMTEAQAIEQFDITFLEIHREEEGYEDPEALVLLTPADENGERREIARIELTD
jgi:hypothetical protein